MWIGCGVLAVTTAVLGSRPRWQAAGFTALSTPAALWGCAFLAARLSGTDSAQGSAAVWLAIAIGIARASGLEEPIRQERPRDDFTTITTRLDAEVKQERQQRRLLTSYVMDLLAWARRVEPDTQSGPPPSAPTARRTGPVTLAPVIEPPPSPTRGRRGLTAMPQPGVYGEAHRSSPATGVHRVGVQLTCQVILYDPQLS